MRLCYASIVYAAARREQQARAVLAELQQLSQERYVPPLHLAPIYAVLGDSERAMTELEHGYRERDATFGFGLGDRA